MRRFVGSQFFWPKNMKFGLKWVHVAQYELILRLDGALWLRIIFKPPDPKKAYTNPRMTQKKGRPREARP